MTDFRRLLFPGLALVFGGVIVLVVLELALRIADWPSPGLYRGDVGPLPISMPTADGGSWRRYPGPVRVRHWEYDVELVLNRHGFVERDPAPKETGGWRVGVFGDSFVLGLGVRPEHRFTQVWLDGMTERSGPRAIEVYNFGSVWCGSAQNAVFLAAHAEEYALDEVVLAIFGGNELDDNVRWADYAALDSEAQARDDSAQSSGTSMRTWIRNHSRAAGFLYITLASGFASQAAVVPNEQSVARTWSTTESALEGFVAASGGRPVSIWYLPDTHEWDDENWRAVRAELGLRDEDRHVVRDAIQRWASVRRIPFVDVTGSLSGRSAHDLRFRRDGHWNDAGHAVVGEALALDPSASWYQRNISGHSAREARRPEHAGSR